MLKKIRAFTKKNIILRKLVGYHFASSGFFDTVFRNYRLSEHWQQRIKDVVSCPDNTDIPRCKQAGQIQNGIQFLHNGLKIYLGSYYGPEYARMLIQSRGVHEPQEEKVFAEVLKHVPPGSSMIELGAFWSFYSMWFNQKIEGARNYMIEPDSFNLGHGKRNFGLNGMKGHFTQAFVGRVADNRGKVPTLSVDEFAKQQGLDFIHILHSDIQGFEFEMLQGATKMIEGNRIAYLFISTHSNEVHLKCRRFLIERAFDIIAEADLSDTYSEDGLIVAKAPFVVSPKEITIAKKQKAGSAVEDLYGY
jgi:hypothetical protein